MKNDDDRHIVLKLATGYNVGIDVDTILEMRETGYKEAHYKIPEKEFPFTPGLPKVKLLGTGGTIASRLDYRTGAVIPAFSPGELYGAVPELAEICNLETEKLFAVFSENMGPEQYKKTGGLHRRRGWQGYRRDHHRPRYRHHAPHRGGAFLHAAKPAHPRSDGGFATFKRPAFLGCGAQSDARGLHRRSFRHAEVMVCMFGPTSDEYGLLHQGTRVRKMHSSYRSTFRTIGEVPIARVTRDSVIPIKTDYNKTPL